MAESHVVSALVDKRAELAGQIVRTEQQLGQFRADLIHVDATIRLFAPVIRPETIQAKVIRRSDGWFEPGEVKRRLLDTLRRAGQPLPAPDVVRAVMMAWFKIRPFWVTTGVRKSPGHEPDSGVFWLGGGQPPRVRLSRAVEVPGPGG